MISRFKNILLLILCISIITQTGCWDYQDVNRRTLAISVGIDLEGDKIRLSGELAKLKSEFGKSREKAEITNTYNLISSGANFEEARGDYDMKVPFPDFSGAVRIVVFSRQFAEKGIEPYLNRINKLPEYRTTVLLAVSREPPEELFNINVQNDISASFFIEDMFEYLSKRGKALYRNLGNVLSDISNGQIGYLLPYIGKDGDSIKYIGIAVMKESKLIGIINANDSKGIMYLLARETMFNEAVKNPKDDENIVSVNIALKKRKVKTDYANGKIVINLDIKLEAQIQYQYYIRTLTNEDMREMEETISQMVKEQIESVVEKSQNLFESDIFKFALHFKAENSKVYKQINWIDSYPEAEINIKTSTSITNTNFLDLKAHKKN